MEADAFYVIFSLNYKPSGRFTTNVGRDNFRPPAALRRTQRIAEPQPTDLMERALNLNAYVFKPYPNALNFAACFGSLGAARTGIDKGAGVRLARLQ